MDAIPTLICPNPSLIARDQPVVKRLLELAAQAKERRE
jgi:hypothetical protein